MTESLASRIAQLRRRARFALVAHGACRATAAAVAAVTFLALADYLIQFEDRGMRVLSAVAALTIIAFAIGRYLVPVVTAKLSDLQLARRIEKRFPHLADRLSSAVEFTRQAEEEPHAGSASLRRAVILQTSAELEQIDLRTVLSGRAVRRSASLCFATLSVAASLFALNIQSAQLAVARLLNPLSADRWPQEHRLSFRGAPSRLGSGGAFTAELVDVQGRLPAQVSIFYRTGDSVETEQLRAGGQKLAIRRDSVSRSFSYRAEGGDDHDMPWHQIEVVAPPKLLSLAVKLHWPAYTGWQVATSDPNIRALKGTSVEFAGKVDRPLRRAELTIVNGPSRQLALSASGREFYLPASANRPLLINESAEYWLQLVDRQGIVGGRGRQYTLTAVADEAPTAAIDWPTTNLTATAAAILPVSIVARDDIKLRGIALLFSRSDRTDVQEFPVQLWTGPAKAPQGEPASLDSAEGDRRVQRYDWSLSSLELPLGADLSFYAAATDYLGQVGKSSPRRITIVRPQELEQLLAEQSKLVLVELTRALQLEREVGSATHGLEVQIAQVGTVTRGDVDQGHAASLNQSQVRRILTDKSDGVPSILEHILETIRINRLDASALERRMSLIAGELKRLEREHLGPLDHELASGLKSAQASLAGSADAKALVIMAGKSLERAGKHQNDLIESLERLLGELSQWDSYRRFSGEIAQMEREQRDILAQSEQLGAQTLAKNLNDLDTKQRAGLTKLRDRQTVLARRLEGLDQSMGDMATTLKASNPEAATALSDAGAQLKQSSVTTLMRESAQGMADNRIAQSSARQQQILHELAEIADILAGRKHQSLEGLVKKLQESQKELDALRTRQQGLRKKMDSARSQPSQSEHKRELERLTHEQRELEEVTSRLARKLERLDARQAGQAVSQASGSMKQAGDASAQGRGDAAAEKALAAERKLNDASQALAKARQQAEELLARQEMIRLENTLDGLRLRQKALHTETLRLDELRIGQGHFTRPQIASLRELARDQRQLAGETKDLADKLATREVMQLALLGAHEYMSRAGQLLQARDTGASAQAAQTSAMARLAALLSALGKPRPKPGQDGSPGGGGSGGQKGGEPDYSLAELKMLKTMQEELAVQVRSLAGRRDHSPDNSTDEFAALARQQGKLAELALKLSEPAADAAEDDPAKAIDQPDGNVEEPDQQQDDGSNEND